MLKSQHLKTRIHELSWVFLLFLVCASRFVFGAEQAAKNKSLIPPGLTQAIEESSRFNDLGSAQSAEQEILPTADYLDFGELDPMPEGVVEWNTNSSRFLYLNQGELPYVYFMGKLKAGHSLLFQKEYVSVDSERHEFSIRVPLRLKPTVFEFRVVAPDGKIALFRVISYWLKLPSTFSFKVKSNTQVVEVGKSFYTRFESSAFAQLYDKIHPTQIIDLDSQAYAQLNFRIYAPPMREEIYDGWELLVRDPSGKTVAKVSRLGYPPLYVDWRELGLENVGVQEFTYQVNLFNHGKTFSGPTNRFRTVQGMAVVDHSYLPPVMYEPRVDFGFLQFKNKSGLSYGTAYWSGDLSVIFQRKFLLRGFALSSVLNGNPASIYSMARVGGGFRIFGAGNGRLDEFSRYRMDILFNYSSIVVSPSSSDLRFSLASMLIESHVVLWNRHYLTPWFEIGAHHSLSAQRMSFGIGYDFVIRPWFVRVGLNVAYDWLFHSSPRPESRFGVYKTSASFSFFL